MPVFRFLAKLLGLTPRVIKRGPAARVVFFYQGEEGTYVDEVYVTIFENGIVHIESPHEETTTHLQNCEILWSYATQSDERVSKLRLVKKNIQDPALDEDQTSDSPQPEL